MDHGVDARQRLAGRRRAVARSRSPASARIRPRVEPARISRRAGRRRARRQDLLEQAAARLRRRGALSSTTSRSIPSPWRSSAASTALPRNPEAPVRRTLLPASLSRTRWFPSLLTGAILGLPPGRPPRRGREVAPGRPPKWAEAAPQYNFPQWRAERDGDDAGRIPRSGKRSWSPWGSCSPRSRSPAAAAGTWAVDVYNSAPPLSSLQPVQKGRSSAIYAADGSLIGFIRSSNIRQPVSDRAAAAGPQGRDGRDRGPGFFDHGAIDPAGDRPRRAQEHRWPAASRSQGASTITQQLVRNLYIQHPEQTIKRKLIEAHLAVRGGGSALEDLDPHRLPEHRPLRHGRRARPRSAPRRPRRPTSASRPRTST